MIVDLHCHWIPPDLARALRARRLPPRISVSEAGERLEVFREALPYGSRFADVDARVAFMDRCGVDRQVLSLPGLFGIDSLPVDEALPLVRQFNEDAAALCRARPDRFSALAALPLANPAAAADELTRACKVLGLAGAILPVDGFLDRARAEHLMPVLEAADALGDHVFVHPGPVRADLAVGGASAPSPADNAGYRHVVLAVQAAISQAMMTLTMTDLLDDLGAVTVQVANLGGALPFYAERLDEVRARRMPNAPRPSARLGRVYVDAASFGSRSIALAVAVYGVERVVLGTDCPIFATESVLDALRKAPLSDEERALVLGGNAARLGFG